MQAFARAARPLSLLVVSLALLLPDGQAQAQAAHGSTTASPAFDAALVEYERNHWPQAFAALSSLSDGGHPEAARIAWQMWRFGAALVRAGLRGHVAPADGLVATVRLRWSSPCRPTKWGGHRA